jgi:hypothetical protein
VVTPAVAPVAVLLGQIGEEPQLKHAVVLHHPAQLLADERLEDRRHHLAVRVGGEIVTDVVHERCDHILLVLPVAQRAGRGLERVRVARHLVPAERVLQLLQRRQDPIGQRREELGLERLDQRPVLGGSVFHPGECHGVHAMTSPVRVWIPRA